MSAPGMPQSKAITPPSPPRPEQRAATAPRADAVSSFGSIGADVDSSRSLLRQASVDDDAVAPATKYGDESIGAAFRSRVGWLGLFLVGLWAAAFVIDAFEHTLQRNVELAHFVPLIIGQGGNAGSQAVSSVIRALAGKEIDARSQSTRAAVLGKEAAVGALCGAVLGIFVLAVGVACRIVSFNVGVVVAISLPLVSLWANFLGAVLPLLAASLDANPALTSAPLMTTIIDSSGLLIYFYVAHFYLRFQNHRVDHHHLPHGHHAGHVWNTTL